MTDIGQGFVDMAGRTVANPVRRTAYGNQIITCRPDGFFANVKKATRISDDAQGNLDLFLELAGADYTVSAHQISNPVTGELVPSQYVVIRDADNVVLTPKTVTESYGLVSPSTLADSVRGLVQEGWAECSDFMFLTRENIEGNGEVMSLKLNTGRNAAGEDDLAWFVILTNFHGRGKVKARIVCFRPFCANQMGAIMAEFDWAVSHRVPKGKRGVTADRVSDAASQWSNLNQHLDRIAERLDLIRSLPLMSGGARVLVNDLLSIPQNATEDDISGQKRNQRDAILEEFYNPSRGTFGQNGWDLLNAVTAVNTHGHDLIGSKVGPSRRSAAILSGTAGKREAKMVSLLLKAALN